MLSPKLLEALRDYWRGLRRRRTEWLFPGNAWHTSSRPVTTKVFWTACQSAAGRAGLDKKRIYPHLLRHCFAKRRRCMASEGRRRLLQIPRSARKYATAEHFRQRINRLWYQVQMRRSQRARKMWDTLSPFFERWIPRPRVLHPYPQVRFYAIHPS
jgi:hypothetical protein